MKDFSDCEKQFSIHSQAWWSQSSQPSSDFVDEITIGFYDREGGCAGEFGVRWCELAGSASPQLQVWDEDWQVLAAMPELIELLAKLGDTRPSVSEFAGELTKLGFVDRTPRVSPYDTSDRQNALRRQALAKLTPEERAALGL